MQKIIGILFLVTSTVFAQDVNELFSKRGEIYFSFKYKYKNQLDDILDNPDYLNR